MASINYQSALVCCKGCVRGNNEDNFYFLGDYMKLKEMDAGAHIVTSGSKDRQTYAIFDGMGGEQYGEKAAFFAAEMFMQQEGVLFNDLQKNVADYARTASLNIYEYAQKHNSAGMGSTFAGLLIQKGKALAVNVGDSRVYRLRDQCLELMTKDHSYVYDLYLAGRLTREQARKHPRNNVITRYLGMPEDKIDDDFIFVEPLELCYQDRFMLCSDGLCDLLSDAQIEEILVRQATPDGAATALAQAALELGGKDNITCIVTDVLDKKLKRES